MARSNNHLQFGSGPAPGLMEEAADRVKRLALGLESHDLSCGAFKSLQTILAALPLSTQEFGLAQCRLVNAYSYRLAGEIGAARYELHLLTKTLAT